MLSDVLSSSNKTLVLDEFAASVFPVDHDGQPGLFFQDPSLQPKGNSEQADSTLADFSGAFTIVNAKTTKLSTGLFTVATGGAVDLVGVNANAPEGLTIVDMGAQAGIVIDAVAVDGTADALLADLTALGLSQGAAFGNVVSGILPATALTELDGLETLASVRESRVFSNAGSVTTQADASLRSDEARAQFGVDGSGVSIGILSDSFNALGGLNMDISTGDLPSGIQILDDLTASGDDTDPSDEGRGMAQLIFDIAPGADLLFHTAFTGIANFAQGIIDLANAGADIIVDDVVYFAESFFQDGIIAQAVDQVAGLGVLYYSSAGNTGTDSYESVYRSSGIGFGPSFGTTQGVAHDFDPGTGVDTRQLISLDDGDEISLSLQYDEPFASAGGLGPSSDYDIFLVEAGTSNVVAESVSGNGTDAVEIFQFTNDTGSTQQYEIIIIRFSGSTNNLLKYVDFSGDAEILEWATNSPTVIGHANANGAVAVGASAFFNTPEFGLNPPSVNGFSSRGGVPILFDTAGNRLASPEFRNKPLFTAPDGGNTTFFGSDIGFDSDSDPNFFGTSASAPAAAAVAALLLEAVPAATASEINQALVNTAIDIGAAGIDTASGAGLIQADGALAELLSLQGNPNLIEGTPGPDALGGTPGNDTITGFAGADTLSGNGGADFIDGGPDADNLSGGDGNDTIDGGSTGADILGGGSGDDLLIAGSNQDTLFGGSGNDTLSSAGGGGTDSFFGEDGNDLLIGAGSEESLDGGAGADTLDGGIAGADLLLGGIGDDSLIAASNLDTLRGGDGDDTLTSIGRGGDDQFFGEDGNDLLTGAGSNETLDGGAGADTLDGGVAGADLLLGGTGNDMLIAGSNLDTLRGGDGDDTISSIGRGGDDEFFGDAGNDLITGSRSAETLSGGNDNDTLDGGNGGADLLLGDAGNDMLIAGSNLDTLRGGDGNDVLTSVGQGGDDELYGEGGDDLISGSASNEILSGGAGTDTITIGQGNDEISGGPGDDLFLVVSLSGTHIITDFEQTSTIERIDLSAVSGISDFADLAANHLSADPVTGDAIITVGTASIVIAGVDPNIVEPGDFIF